MLRVLFLRCQARRKRRLTQTALLSAIVLARPAAPGYDNFNRQKKVRGASLKQSTWQAQSSCRTDKKRKIRCAVIGTGRIGSSLETDSLREKPASHAGAIANNRETILVAGADGDIDQLSAFGKLWRLPRAALFTDAASMLDTVKPDIVHIAADTEAHVPLLLTCLENSVPVIVLEKPVASSLEEARSVLNAVEKAEKAQTSRIVVNHERRFAADYRRVKELIGSRELGALRSVHCRLFMGMKKAPEKVLWHDGTHLVDILSFLVGPWVVTATHGNVSESDGEFLIVGQTMTANAQNAGGTKSPSAFLQGSADRPVLIGIEASSGRDHLVFELDLSFSAGRARVGNGTFEVWKSEESRFYENFRSLKLAEGKQGKPYGKTGYFSGMMAHAVELFRDPEKPGLSTFQDGLAALELLDRIIRKKGK